MVRVVVKVGAGGKPRKEDGNGSPDGKGGEGRKEIQIASPIVSPLHFPLRW
jgi:hypothetical protein